MPRVYKSSAVEALDAFFGGAGGQGDNYEYARELLERNDSLSALTAQVERDLSLEPGALDHFKDHWLAGASGKKVDRVMRDRYKEAIEAADSPRLPIETFWVTEAGDDFDIHVCKGTGQVTVLVFIPRELEERATGQPSTAP
jgi:3'-phosphoadenosine 5'-phosphosulfate sulfotransferase (PAPS reductase)/FAD synthetase